MYRPTNKGLTMAPSVLILGGLGFIGRNFVEYLLSNNLVESIRVVDKLIPVTAYLNSKQKLLFEDPRVEFRQANLCNESDIFDANFNTKL